MQRRERVWVCATSFDGRMGYGEVTGMQMRRFEERARNCAVEKVVRLSVTLELRSATFEHGVIWMTS